MDGVLDQIRRQASIPYRIVPNGSQFGVWRYLGQGMWTLVAKFSARDYAEDWLLTKVPQIEG